MSTAGRQLRTAGPTRWTAGGLLSCIIGYTALIPACPGLAAPAAEGGAPAPRPNFVFFLADDLGYGDLGCSGHPRIRTPHLDQLAAEGTRFTQFYASASTCSPTRTSAITGQYPARWRIHGPIGFLANNTAAGMPHWLDVTAPTMPRTLQQAGYRTAHFGKWHLGGGSGSRSALGRSQNGAIVINHPSAPPVASYGFEVVRAMSGNGPTWREAQPVDRPHDRYAYDEPEWQTWSSRAICDAAIGFLQDHARHGSGRPFLLHVWLSDPHTPLRPTEAMRFPYRDVPEPAQTHYAMVSFMDEQIGRVLGSLDTLGFRQDTIVVFASDNGAAEGRGGSNGPLRGWKWYLYEGGIRVPLIARWPRPGGIPAGRVDHRSVLSVCDLPAAFLKLAGIRPPDAFLLDGTDQAGVLLGRPQDERPPLRWFHPGSRNQKLAVRDGRWKLLMNPDGSRTELYDLERDPAERTELTASHPEVIERLRSSLTAWYTSLPSPPAPRLRTATPDRKQ